MCQLGDTLCNTFFDGFYFIELSLLPHNNSFSFFFEIFLQHISRIPVNRCPATGTYMDHFQTKKCVLPTQDFHKIAKVLLLFLTNQGQIMHNLRLDTHIHMQFRRVRSFSLAVRFQRTKIPKVRGVIGMLSLDILSVAG